ncbi:MAG: Transaldolase [Parcubacteria group bacterium GW2011_GWA2_38_13]|nr:MAG: Transaldolase [Parcubacteria group bacterium GW2011_GWA2_38_13]
MVSVGNDIIKNQMRPKNLKTKIFLDSGDPNETKEILATLGFLDGQTTNPSLIAKNPEAQKRLAEGKKFTLDEIYGFYKGVVQEISNLIPNGSVSIEVYADKDTKAEEMLKQGKEMFVWIPNAHIKFPITSEGLRAAKIAVKDGLRVNMTLCFSQEQAAAVYAATRGAKKGQVFISPFIGRLDDKGLRGVDLVKNIIEMYKKGDGHVEVLAASARSIDHLYYSISMGADIITAPLKILSEWHKKKMIVPKDYEFYSRELQPIFYKDIALDKPWHEFNIQDDLTDAGIEKFAADWNLLINY